MTLTQDGLAHQARMNRKYRYDRHVFDLSRRFFLFGRNAAIDLLALSDEDTLMEIGVGTARNLVEIARRSSPKTIIGLDISTEMLKSARAKLTALGLEGRIELVEGDATEEVSLGGVAPSKILMSYSLSMIPDWRRGLRSAVASLAPGGRLVIVDFGDFAGLPRPLAAYAIGSLSRHDAPPCLDLEAELNRLTDVRHSHCYGPLRFYRLVVIEKSTDAG